MNEKMIDIWTRMSGHYAECLLYDSMTIKMENGQWERVDVPGIITDADPFPHSP